MAFVNNFSWAPSCTVGFDHMETLWDRHVHDVCVCLYNFVYIVLFVGIFFFIYILLYCTHYYLYLFVGLSYYYIYNIYITILYTSTLHCVVYCVNVCCIVLFGSLHCYYFGKSRTNDEPCFFLAPDFRQTDGKDGLQ